MAGEEETAVFSAPASALSDDQVKELQDRFGLQLHVRASNEAVKSALGRIGDAAVQSFDRTNPSYGRVYDKSSAGDIRDQVVNPVELESKIRDIVGRMGRERPSG